MELHDFFEEYRVELSFVILQWDMYIKYLNKKIEEYRNCII